MNAIAWNFWSPEQVRVTANLSFPCLCQSWQRDRLALNVAIADAAAEHQKTEEGLWKTFFPNITARLINSRLAKLCTEVFFEACTEMDFFSCFNCTRRLLVLAAAHEKFFFTTCTAGTKTFPVFLQERFSFTRQEANCIRWYIFWFRRMVVLVAEQAVLLHWR